MRFSTAPTALTGAARSRAFSSDSEIDEAKKEALKYNAVDVKIVFEDSRPDSHQDFGDCGKAKTIAKSLIATFDVRDGRNKRSRDLVLNTPFLKAYVDATASNVNLSAKSRKIWSMSAIRMFVGHVVDHHHDAVPTQPVTRQQIDEATANAEAFFTALGTHLPQLHALDEVKDVKDPGVTAGQYGDLRGGDIALRGVGVAIFARAFLYCQEHGVSFKDMALKLATLDWHLLSREREELPREPSLYAGAVQQAVLPMWAHLVAFSEAGYRIRSSSEDANTAWSKIEAQLFGEKADKAA